MGTVGIIVVYAVILGGMWFLLMRPQKKEQKRIQAMLADMEIGDTALTTSGFYGVIIDITDDYRAYHGFGMFVQIRQIQFQHRITGSNLCAFFNQAGKAVAVQKTDPLQ